MDPITVINLAFVHEQGRSWARAATARPVVQLAKETLLGRIGDRLIVAGIWLKMRTTPLPVGRSCNPAHHALVKASRARLEKGVVMGVVA